MKIRSLLVDDEPLARHGLRNLLADRPEMEVVGESADGPSAVLEIQRLRPDLVFLDVQMPGLDGFEVLDALRPDPLPAVIFVTAYDLHAMHAFQVHAVDYLLKPIDPARLGAALDRAERLLRPGASDLARVEALLAAHRNERRPVQRLLIKSTGSLSVVQVNDIEWIEADGDYARLHLPQGEHLLRETLSALEEQLDAAKFVRIHRSYIVRTDRVRQVLTEPNGDSEVVLMGGTRLASSRTYRERLLSALKGTA